MKVNHETRTTSECDLGYGLRAKPPVENVAFEKSDDCENVEPAEAVVFNNTGWPGAMGIVELILKDRPRLHRVIRDPRSHADVIPRFLAISLVGFAFYGVAMSVVLHSSGLWPKLADVKEWFSAAHGPLIMFKAAEGNQFLPWWNGSAFKLIAAYAVGLVAATGICLPSLYFYSLLSGIRMSMIEVTVHALKSKATTAVALVGILPIYAAIAMGMVIFDAPRGLLEQTMLLGMILPFIAGLWGTTSLYVGFAGLCDRLPAAHRERRECFLRRLVLSWAACYTAIMPVMIYTLWESLGT